jgi:hypothetical protein
MGSTVERAQDVVARTDSDGVLVVSVWLEGAEGFLGRMTATMETADGGDSSAA